MRRVSLVLFLLAAPTFVDARATNVVVILSDDQGWGDLSINGNTNLRTPHVDSIAKGGVHFDRFFVQPVCSPTRAELLTGRWHLRGGVRGVSTGGERLNLDEDTIADAFRAAGYVTGCFGKWHNGSQYPYHPNGRGFMEYYGFTSGHWGEYFDAPLDHNGKSVKGKGYLTDELTDRAIAFLKKNAEAGKPSFVYVAYNTPHSPMQVPDKYWERFAKAKLKLFGTQKEDIDHTRAALAMCENIDDNVGRLLEALKSAKIDKDTIVVYFCDNGPNGPRYNGGMKGHKGSTDEGGVRSPLHVRWPGKIMEGGTVPVIAAAVDLYPTLIDLAGVKRAGDKPFDGISLAPWLLGKEVKEPQRLLFQHWAGRTSARSQKFRLDATGKLFDMTKDPKQERDVSSEHIEETKRLTDAVATWRREVLGTLTKTDDRPFTVGYNDLPRTVLPARDGVGHGGVQRSANAPNCSYFTKWTKAEDSLTWQIEVKTAGKYEALMQYTCTKSDVGSQVELSAGKTKWTATISEAHDPPLRGKADDRVPRRGESYVKDFRPMSLGIVELPAGRATLTLRATKVAGLQVADVRAVELVLTK